MACFNPLLGYYARERSANGKRRIVFERNLGFADRPVAVPCGQCIGCRLEHSRQWAVRCMHEASLFERNCFITLTYNNFYLPFVGAPVASVEGVSPYAAVSERARHFYPVLGPEGPNKGFVFDRYFGNRVFPSTLLRVDTQLFMKRLRKKYGKNIRVYGCGEYGEKYGRPHYHFCLFNHDFADKVVTKEQDNGYLLFESASLNDLWAFGSHTIGELTFDSAAYCARYVTKKLTGEDASGRYCSVEASTGEIFSAEKEFPVMSRRPGLGARWIDKFEGDVYPSDFVVVNGAKARPARYYDNRYELSHEDVMQRVRKRRVRVARKYTDNNTPERLRIRALVAKAKLKLKSRNLEGE